MNEETKKLLEKLRWRSLVLEDGSRQETTIKYTQEALLEAASCIRTLNQELTEALTENSRLQENLTKLESHTQRLKDALEPFAREADRIESDREGLVTRDDWSVHLGCFNLGMCRRARAARNENE